MRRSPSSDRRVIRTVLAAARGIAGTEAAAADAPVAIAHDDVSCIVANRHPQVDACLTPAESVGRAQVHFRAGGTDAWYAVDLKPEGRCFRGLLPRPLTTTQAVEYYVDVVDRGFTESRLPDRAPDVAYTARVVAGEKACTAGRLAAFAGRLSQPVVVSVLRGGQAVATALGAPPALVGFSSEGVILLPPAAAGQAPSASSGTQPASAGSGASGAAAGGATVAGIGVTTLAIAGGAVVAAGVVAAAASGGDDGPDGGNGGGATDLTGNWSGPWTSTVTGAGLPAATCAFDVSMVVRHSGGTFTATGTSGGGQCAVPGGGVAAGGGSGTLTGTASGGRLAFSLPFGDAACPPFQYTGTYTASSMSGTMTNSCNIGGTQLNWTGTFSATRR